MTGGDYSTSWAARGKSPRSTRKSASRRCCHRDAQRHLGTQTAGSDIDVPAPSGHWRYFLVLGLRFYLPTKKRPVWSFSSFVQDGRGGGGRGRGGDGPLESPETINQKPVSKSDHGFKRLCSAGGFQARGLCEASPGITGMQAKSAPARDSL
jgi:hypothetical protein